MSTKNKLSHTAIPSTDNIICAVTDSRSSSQLSGTYDFIPTASQISTPFSASPIIPSFPLITEPSPIITPLPIPPTVTESEDMAAEIITPFHGDKEDENPEDFLRAFHRRMGDKTKDARLNQFPYYLQADSVADELFVDLVDNDKKTWGDVETAFKKRWLRKKQALVHFRTKVKS